MGKKKISELMRMTALILEVISSIQLSVTAKKNYNNEDNNCCRHSWIIMASEIQLLK